MELTKYDVRPLSGGLAGCCRSAWQGLGFPASAEGAAGIARPFLPPELVLLIDALVRAMERGERLRAMNGGNFGKTLWLTALKGGLKDVRFLLALGADAGAENGNSLCGACCFGHLRVAEALLDAGGTLTPFHRSFALLHSAQNGHTACCGLLLDRGADIHYGVDSALCGAAGGGLAETVAFLLDRSAWSEWALESATEAATTNQHDAVIALLLARRER